MTSQQFKSLVGVLVVILLIALGLTAINYFRSKSDTKFLLSGSENPKISKFEVTSTTADLRFENLNGAWQVNNYLADITKITALFGALNQTSILNVASTNHQNYSIFNVDDTSGTTANFFEGNTNVLSIVIGKTAQTGSYLRVLGDSNVYQTNQDLQSVVSGTLNDFRDKTLSAGDLSNLDKIITSSFQLNSSGSGFVLNNNPTTLDQSKTQSFANNLINLKGTDIASDDQVTKIKTQTPILTFKISFKNSNVTYGFEIFKIDDNTFVANRDSDKSVLTLDKSQVDNINKSIDDLKQ